MSGPSGAPITLELGDLADLFEAPAFDVDDPPALLGSGMDELTAEVEAALPHAPTHLDIVVPAAAVAADADERVRAAIARWCDLHERDARRQARAARRDGLRVFPVGLAVLAIGLGLEQLFRTSGLSAGIRDYFANGLFLVAAWVALWHPIESVLYGWRPAARTRRILRVIEGMDVRVRAAEPAG